MTVEPSDNKENEEVLEIDRELLMRDVDDDRKWFLELTVSHK